MLHLHVYLCTLAGRDRYNNAHPSVNQAQGVPDEPDRMDFEVVVKSLLISKSIVTVLSIETKPALPRFCFDAPNSDIATKQIAFSKRDNGIYFLN
ncbi:hypothetical protein TNIN_349541 [Trichonephila inaurata madagascariensis]|uniref:Uncharacterized protein n=1 Tax=Trichonephila inaurata madagascariensis TaxID=2747483 RepID=A0A8X6X8H5_9ARAC|nr:hypothetical protein TNIN_349541 [Trichonephila inaurata madagascariensis]